MRTFGDRNRQAGARAFPDRVGQFEDGLRGLLEQASPTGEFSEQMRELAVDLWRP